MEDNKDRKPKRSAFDAAGDYLSHKMRTEAEVLAKLREKGYEQEEIAEAIAELKLLKYIDDYEYALHYFDYSYSKHRGHKRAARELEEKGVSSETVQMAYEDYCYENKVDEYEEALAIARAQFELKGSGVSPEGHSGHLGPSPLEGKVARKLERQGFGTDVIYKVLSEMRKWNDSEEQ